MRSLLRFPARYLVATSFAAHLVLGCAVDTQIEPLPGDADAPSAGVSTGEESSPNGGSDGGEGIVLPDLDPGPIVLEPSLPEPNSFGQWTLEERDLTAFVPEGASFVGVTVGPKNGVVYLLDRKAGIYALGEETAELVYAAGTATTDADIKGDFTDLAAITDDLFAITAPDDGYLLDLSEATLSQHFCYLPPFEPDLISQVTSASVAFAQAGRDVFQITDALAYDQSSGLIWAQPRTIDVSTGEVLASELANFNDLSGDPAIWYLLPEVDLTAGGMAVTENEVIIAVDSWLRVYDSFGMNVVDTVDLSKLGLAGISGMTAAGTDKFYLVTEQSPILFTLTRAPAQSLER